jgi:hypothetical protein
MIAGAVGLGAGYLLLPLAAVAVPLLLTTVGIFVATLSATIFSVVGLTVRQRMAPAGMLGRTNASMRTINWGALPLGFFLGGVLGNAIGLVPTITVGALGLLLCSLPLLRSPVRTLRDLPASANPG